jgi:hypothetical protein
VYKIIKTTSMNKIIKTTSLIVFLLMNFFSPLFAQLSEKEKEAYKQNQKSQQKYSEYQKEMSLYIFNTTNSKIEFNVIYGNEYFSETLEPYKPQKENYEDINGKLFISGLNDRQQYYMPDYDSIPDYIEYKPTSESSPIVIKTEYDYYTSYVFYLSEGKLKLEKVN